MRATHFVFRVSMCLCIAVLAALILPQFAAAKSIYVEVGGTGVGTLESPYGSIQTALSNAVAGDTIYVGEGTFTGCYTLKNGVSLLGKGAGKTTLQGNGSDCVLYGSSAGSSTVVSGFTIMGGMGRVLGVVDPNSGLIEQKRVGGAIILFNSSPRIENNTIRNNDSYYWGSGLGGALYLSSSSPQIRNNTFSSNRAGYGGAFYVNTGSNPTIENNTLSSNTAAGYGGAIAFGQHASSTSFAYNTITSNTADFGGGAISVDYGSGPNIVNNIIANNSVTGLYGQGGGIYCLPYSVPKMTNNTITGNTAKYAGAGICAEYSSPSVVVKNCIIWGNLKTGTSTPLSVKNLSPTYSNIEGGAGGVGNISSDPLFVNAASGDYSLKVSSPSVNSGTLTGAPSSDILGTSRPQGAGFDMGALERKASELTVPLLNEAVSVTFPAAWASNTTVAVKAPLATGQTPPADFTLVGDAYYDISTTADRDGLTAKVTLSFDDTDLSETEKASIRLYHFKNGSWEDITDAGQPNAAARTVSGTTTSFSGFGVFYTEDAPALTTSTPASSGWSILLLVGLGMAGLVTKNQSHRNS